MTKQVGEISGKWIKILYFNLANFYRVVYNVCGRTCYAQFFNSKMLLYLLLSERNNELLSL